jgi:nucleotide sugar dehydrogenase
VKVAIIGLGTVGRAMVALFEGRADLVLYDRADGKPYPVEDLSTCDFAMVCVDTPSAPDGSCDTSKVEQAIAELPCDRVLLRSSVPPGTTDRLAQQSGKQICFAPEYIGESAYLTSTWVGDAAAIPFFVIGGAPDARRWLLDRLVGVLGPYRVYFQCSAVEAELIKYMENAFFATKVAFVNEFAGISETMGADWHTVREGWLLDPRIGRSSSAHFPDNPGFGGKCLPKDLRAIVAAASSAGYEPTLLQSVIDANARHRGDDDDSVIVAFEAG